MDTKETTCLSIIWFGRVEGESSVYSKTTPFPCKGVQTCHLPSSVLLYSLITYLPTRLPPPCIHKCLQHSHFVTLLHTVLLLHEDMHGICRCLLGLLENLFSLCYFSSTHLWCFNHSWKHSWNDYSKAALEHAAVCHTAQSELISLEMDPSMPEQLQLHVTHEVW